MKCPNCGSDNNSVIDSRPKNGGQMRIRRCYSCDVTFKTHEEIGDRPRVKEKPLPMWYARHIEKERTLL